MKRNSALRGLAWVGMMVVANATPLGTVCDNTVTAISMAFNHVPTDGEVWVGTFVILTGLCIYLGNRLVDIWGENEETPVEDSEVTRKFNAVMKMAAAEENRFK